MRRRQVLSALALAAASFAGCSAPGAPGTDDGTETDTQTEIPPPEPTAEPTSTDAVTPDPDDPIAVVLYNGTDETLSVQVTVTESERVLLERTLSVAPDDEPSLDTGIREPGSYELKIAIGGGPSRTTPMGIESYDVRMGSNAIAELSMEQIRIYFEE